MKSFLPNKQKSSNENLSSVSISQNNMNRTHCYNFWVRNTDGKYFLDADCIIDNYNEYKEIIIEEKEIAEEDFNRFLVLDEKYDFRSQKKPKEKKNSPFFICDETIIT